MASLYNQTQMIHESKAMNTIYNSRFSIDESIHTISTEYDSLIDIYWGKSEA